MGGGAYLKDATVVLQSCTLYGNSSPDGGAIMYEIIEGGGHVQIDKTIISQSPMGPAISCGEWVEDPPTLTCCDLYGNVGGDWVGCIAEQESLNGNICADPLFCDPDNGDFTLRSDSPCAGENNPECGEIGALPVGCVPAGVAQEIESSPVCGAAPNPFLGSTRLTMSLPRAAESRDPRLMIHDVAGRLVRTLSIPSRSPGAIGFLWDGTDDVGRRVAPGVYFYHPSVAGQVEIGRVVLLR